MTITIPLAALEAAARRVALLLDWDDWGTMHEADRELCRVIARAAALALLENWPGMKKAPTDWERWMLNFPFIILPLDTQEKRDDR